MRHRSTGVTLAAAIVAALACSSASPDPAAQASGGSGAPLAENLARSWYRNFDYGVEKDGKSLPDTGLYQIVGSPYMLVFGASLDSAYVLSFDPKVVKPVGKEQVTPRSDLEVLLPESAFAASTPIPWMQDGPTAVVFYAGSNRYKIARVPPIVGPTSTDEIIAHDPMYRRGMDEYRPNADAVSAIRRVQGKVQVEVWFGSWCPHCRQVVPQFMKIVQAAGNANLGIVYHGVPREFGQYPPAVQKDVKGLPTFIFLRDGKEISRIQGGPERGTLEGEIADALKGVRPASGG